MVNKYGPEVQPYLEDAWRLVEEGVKSGRDPQEQEDESGERRQGIGATSRQLKTMWAGIGLVGVLLILPPWKFTFAQRELTVDRAGPYAFVFSPPKIPVTTPSTKMVSPFGRPYDTDEYFEGYSRRFWSVRIDGQRLLLPVCGVTVVTIGLLVTFRERRPRC